MNWSNGQVVVERLDHPVAPGPHGTIDVGLVAEGVGIPRHVEPVHAIRSPNRGEAEQPVDEPLVGIRPLSARKASISASVGGRPVRSNVTRRINRSLLASGEGESPSASSRARTNRSIAFRGHAGVLDLRQGDIPGRDERPVVLPLGPLLDPPLEQVDLLRP